MVTRILQLSDCHILADPDAEIRGVNTHRCLANAADLIRDQFADVDCFVLTGDIASDEELDSYRNFHELWKEFLPRSFIIPGNHDDRGAMREILAERCNGEMPFITFSQALNGWRLIGLDSLVAGEVHGAIGAEQLDWLAAELQTHVGEPTLLFMHHPPVDVDSEWLDCIGLKDRETLASLVAAAPQIQAIFAGHIHQEHAGLFAGTPVLATPSTAIQFRPGTTAIEIDDVRPGFRVIELHGHEMMSFVNRMPQKTEPADPES